MYLVLYYFLCIIRSYYQKIRKKLQIKKGIFYHCYADDIPLYVTVLQELNGYNNVLHLIADEVPINASDSIASKARMLSVSGPFLQL